MLIFTKTKQMKTVTLEEIKDQYAKEHGYNSFIDMCPNKALFESASDEISKRYAKAKLEEAAENARAYLNANDEPIVIKKSITETPLD